MFETDTIQLQEIISHNKQDKTRNSIEFNQTIIKIQCRERNPNNTKKSKYSIWIITVGKSQFT